MKSSAIKKSRTKRPTFSFGRWFYFLLALLVAVTASFLAFRQTLRPDPLNPPSLFSAAWWKYPIEINPVRRVNLISSNIRDITLAPGTNTLWIAGTGGLIASSNDRGQTWEIHPIFERISSTVTISTPPSPTPGPAFTPSPSPETFPSAVPGPNPPPVFAPSATPVRSPPPKKKASIENKSEYQRVAFAEEKAVTTTSPSPQPQGQLPPTQQKPSSLALTQSPSTSPVSQQESKRRYPDLTAISFYDGNHGYAVGKGGTMVSTTDAGKTWEMVKGGADDDLIAVHFESAFSGVALAVNGQFFNTNNGGTQWEVDYYTGKASIGLRGALKSAFIVTNTEVHAQGADDMVFYETHDGGHEWSGTGAVPPYLTSLGAGLGTVGWIGPLPLIVKIRGINLSVETLRLPAPLTNTILCSDAYDGWAVGDEGVIFATNDGGKSWASLAIWPSVEIKKQWRQAGNHRWFPAPWYYLACLVSLGLCIPVLRRPPSITEKSSVADILASDRPIEPGEPDPLQFNAVALALSRFLRNENTTPPLSIAITGEWGTGKSSLMNLLRGDLRARGFRPVWFNPWHHQKEEHLLAALLENLQAQAIPPIFSLHGLGYRLGLLWFRARRYWRVSLFLATLIAISAGYFAVDPARMERAATELRGITDAIGDFVGERLKKSEPPAKKIMSSSPGDVHPPTEQAAEKPAAFSAAALKIIGDILVPPVNSPHSGEESHAPAAIVLLASLIGSLVAGVKALRSFGVNPATLLATSAAKPSLRDLKAETSFRYKFARQFADVTRALRVLNHRTI